MKENEFHFLQETKLLEISVINGFSVNFPNGATSLDNSILVVVAEKTIDFLASSGALRKRFEVGSKGVVLFVDCKYGNFSAITSSMELLSWNVSRSQPKQFRSHLITINTTASTDVCVKDMKLSFSGKRLAILFSDNSLVIYNIEGTEGREENPWRLSDDSFEAQGIFWDSSDDRVLAVEMIALDDGSSQLWTFFARLENNKIFLFERFACTCDSDSRKMTIIGLSLPEVYFCNSLRSVDKDAGKFFSSKLLPVYESIRQSTSAACSLTDFSYNLAVGNISVAFNSLREVLAPASSSSLLLRPMILACVRSDQIEMAESCLIKSKNCSSIGHYRKFGNSARLVRMAVICIHFDLIDIAIELLEEELNTEFYDSAASTLLIDLLMSRNQWDEAVSLADRFNSLRTPVVRLKEGRKLEISKRFPKAVELFIESENPYREINRMFMQGEISIEDSVEYFIKHSSNISHDWTKEDFSFFGRQCESLGRFDLAEKIYRSENDWFSLCRLYYAKSGILTAKDICDESHDDKATCFFLGKVLEDLGDFKEAVSYYEKSGKIFYALKIAINKSLDVEVIRLAGLGGERASLSAAIYFEKKGSLSSAVQLFRQAGRISKALELCLENKLFDSLKVLVDTVDHSLVDRSVLIQCAEFFKENKHYDKAAYFLALAGEFRKSLDLCLERNIFISQDFAELLTPTKELMDAVSRQNFLLQLGKLCKKQGSFQLACKKFTQAGDKLKALKALIKAGETEKIIFFANTARQADTFVLAANYLMGLDWMSNTQTRQTIENFFMKAKDQEKILRFKAMVEQEESLKSQPSQSAHFQAASKERQKFLARTKSADDEDSLDEVIEDKVPANN